MRSRSKITRIRSFPSFIMVAPRALVFRPLVKGNEALGTRLRSSKTDAEQLPVACQNYSSIQAFWYFRNITVEGLRNAQHFRPGTARTQSLEHSHSGAEPHCDALVPE